MLINLLFWVSIITGGTLLLLMLLSVIGGLDLDVDVDMGSTDVDSDAGGLGVVKGFLTFVSTSSWVIKILVASNQNLGMAIGIGIVVGLVALKLLTFLFQQLMKNESNVNWEISDALYQKGEVYLKIPASQEASGLIQVEINGTIRELKARSKDKIEIKTGDSIVVVDTDGEYVMVTKDN